MYLNLQLMLYMIQPSYELKKKGFAMADALGSVGQRLSNALGRLQEAETKPVVRQLQLPDKTASGPSSSVLVNVKTQTTQAGVDGNGAQAGSGYKSALAQRLSNSLTRLKNESEHLARIAEEDLATSHSSSVEVQISKAARQLYSDKSVDEVAS